MDTLSAFARGAANRNKEQMVFDWIKASKIIKERNAREASAGLRGDWEWTGGSILKDGLPVKESYTFLASTWAVPELEIDGEIIECFKMESELPGWGAKTFWPDEALEVLKEDSK